jgi:hypothetical protein
MTLACRFSLAAPKSETSVCRFGAKFFMTLFPFPPLGPFYTSESRGGVERRQLELKGAEGGY